MLNNFSFCISSDFSNSIGNITFHCRSCAYKYRLFRCSTDALDIDLLTHPRNQIVPFSLISFLFRMPTRSRKRSLDFFHRITFPKQPC